MSNKDYVQVGKLACPDGAAAEFILIPGVPRDRPKFTFSEDNADQP